MPTVSAVPMTARDLLARIEPFGPTVEGAELVFGADPSADLVPAIRLLQTGIRAVLTGRRWFGIDATGRGIGPGREGALEPGRLLLVGVVLLTVEGDSCWDRVHPTARTDLPWLFADDAQASSPRRRSESAPHGR